jgi:hypothetical protein
MIFRLAFIPAALVAAGLALSSAHAATAPAAKAPRACFFQRQMNGWKEVGDRQVNLRIGVNDVYQVDLDSPCWNLRWTQHLGVESRGSSSICTGDTVTLVVPDRTTGPNRCFGRVTHKLTPEEVAALPPKQRP